MRVSFSFASVNELRRFNVSVWDILHTIDYLANRGRPADENLLNWVDITFTPTKGNEETWEGLVRFYEANENGEERFNLEDSAPVDPNFTPPENCNLEESFHWLTTEVAKLAFAMTRGRVNERDIDGLPEVVQKNKSYTMSFYCTGR